MNTIFYKIKSTSHLFLIQMLTFSFLSCVCASSTLEEQGDGVIFKAHIASGRSSYVSHSVQDHVLAVCSDPENVYIDLSAIDLTNDELRSVSQGLVESARKSDKISKKIQSDLKFLDIRSSSIDKAGLSRFFFVLQNSENTAHVPGERIAYPNIREAIVRTNFDINDSFKGVLHDIAPSVFSGGLDIVDSPSSQAIIRHPNQEALNSISDVNLYCYLSLRNRKEYDSRLPTHIMSVIGEPSHIAIDFSLIGLRNEDIGFIVNGLLLRKELLVKDGVTLPLKLLDIRSDYITRKGITRFMYALENNSRLSDVSSDSFIFDEELIVRTNVDLSDGFKESLAEISPRISSRITFL